MANTVPGSPLKQPATPTPSSLPATAATTPLLPTISQHATSPHTGSPRPALTPARDPTLTPPPSTSAALQAAQQPNAQPPPSVLAPFASPTALQLASVRRKRKLEQDGYTPSEVAEIQSRAAAFDYAIALDQYDTLYPAQKKFASIEDAVDRLVPWHIWQAPEAELDLPSPERDAADIKRCGEQAEQLLRLKSRFAKARQREGDHPSDLPSLIYMLRESTALVREEINGLQASLRTFRAQHDGILAEERRVREAKEAKERAAREAEAAKERAAREAQAARERAAREAEAAKERQRLMEEDARRRAEMTAPPPAPAAPHAAQTHVQVPQPVVGAQTQPVVFAGVPNATPSGVTAAASAGPSVAAPPHAPQGPPEPAVHAGAVPRTPLTATTGHVAPSTAASISAGAAVPTTGTPPSAAPPPSAATASPPVPAAVASPTAAPKTPATPPTRGRPRGRPRGSGRGGAHQTAHPHRTAAAAGSPATPQAPVQITVAMNQIPAFAQARIIILPNPDNLKAPATIVRTSEDRKQVTLSIDLGACSQLQLQTLARLLNVQAKLPGAKPAAGSPAATSASTAPAPATASASTSTPPASTATPPAFTSTAPTTTTTLTPAPASTATPTSVPATAQAQSGTAAGSTHITPTAPSHNPS